MKPNSNIINSDHNSYCGIDCDICPVYVATINNDNNLRKRIYDNWKLKKHNIKISEINCMGCYSDKIFGACNRCDIRKCCLEKSIKNCKACETTPCDRLSGQLNFYIRNFSIFSITGYYR
jgi:hypothetical protein